MAGVAEDGDALLSRSGTSTCGGKLTRRIDVPVSEELEDLVISRAVAVGKPRAEFIRDLVQQALTAPHLIDLPAADKADLEAFARATEILPNELASALLRRAIRSDFNMVKSIARQRLGLQSDESGSSLG